MDTKSAEQEKRLDFLIGVLAEQCSLSLPKPESLAEKKELFRALMNVWQVQDLPEGFYDIQDAYLQEELAGRAVQDSEHLVPLQKNLFVWQGDITLLRADAIVNAANSSLLGCFVPLHKCIDNAVHSFAGLQLRAKCNEIMAAQGHAEPTGKAKITPAYNLPSKYVIHTVGPIAGARLTRRDEELLASCYRECLRCACEHNLRSIAFCCISTGEFHFPNQRAAEIAVQTVKSCQADFAAEIKIIFNVFKDIDRAAYTNLLQQAAPHG